MSEPKRHKSWHVPMSSKAQRTTNPIRSIVDKIMMQKREPIPGKPMIPLSLGDPCSFGNLAAPDVRLAVLHVRLAAFDGILAALDDGLALCHERSWVGGVIDGAAEGAADRNAQ